jgi:hypothetical protein
MTNMWETHYFHVYSCRLCYASSHVYQQLYFDGLVWVLCPRSGLANLQRQLWRRCSECRPCNVFVSNFLQCAESAYVVSLNAAFQIKTILHVRDQPSWRNTRQLSSGAYATAFTSAAERTMFINYTVTHMHMQLASYEMIAVICHQLLLDRQLRVTFLCHLAAAIV